MTDQDGQATTPTPSAPTARPVWLRTLTLLMVLLASHLGFQGAGSLSADADPPADTAVVLTGNEARLRAFRLATSIMLENHPLPVRTHAWMQVLLAGVLLFAVAAIFTRDPRGRRLAIGAAWLVGGYQIAHTAFSILIERPALLTVLPPLVEQLAHHGELGKDAVKDVQQGMALATLIGPIVFLAAGLALSAVMLVFFAGRRGRILYGLEKPTEQRP